MRMSCFLALITTTIKKAPYSPQNVGSFCPIYALKSYASPLLWYANALSPLFEINNKSIPTAFHSRKCI